MKEKLVKEFAKIYGDAQNVNVYFAPGRVNLIGEHTDYNGGHVFPCALTIGTYGVVRKNDRHMMRFYSMNFPQLGILEVPDHDYVYDKKDDWANYPKSVMWTFSQKGIVTDGGLDILIYGNIPNGSGLSSSASLEVLTGYILSREFHFPLDGITNALYGQYAENHFIGVNCGIMDQFAVSMGKKDHAIFLNTANLEYTYAPIHLAGAKLVISSSNKKRGLGDSKYNERREECEQALAAIQKVKDVPSLGALTPDEFEQVKGAIPNPIWVKRARHAVYENQRTLEAVEALKAGDLQKFGQLMNASHVSLRDDYEVTGRELDTLVEAAWKQPGVIGSRMTGAGFGGCTVSIVKDEAVESFIREVGKTYLETIGYGADFYVVEIGDGPREI